MKSTKPTNRFHRRGNWVVSTLLAGSVMGLSLQISAIYAQPVRSLYSKNHVPQGIAVFHDAAISAASAGNMHIAVYPESNGSAAPEQAAPQPDLVVYPIAAAVRAAAASHQAVSAAPTGVQLSQMTGSAEEIGSDVPAAAAAETVETAPAAAAGVPTPEAPLYESPADSGKPMSADPGTDSADRTKAAASEAEREMNADPSAGDSEKPADVPSVTTTLALTEPSVLLTGTRAIAAETETKSTEPVAPAYARTAITDVSEDTMALYMGIMATECGSAWDYEGCLMIAQVIVNRVHSGHWGDLYDVLTAPNQFSTYSSGVWATREPTEAQRQAAVDALAGKTVMDEDVLFFCTDAAYQRSSYFQTLDHRATFANTMFFAK